MAQLETLQAGPVISPQTTIPPSITLGPALVTVWGRNRTPDGEAQSVMVRSQGGPVARWGRETLAVINECAAGGPTE